MWEISGFCWDVVEAFYLTECYAAYVGRHPTTFWGSIISPHHQRSSSPRGMRKLSVCNYQRTMSNIPEEQKASFCDVYFPDRTRTYAYVKIFQATSSILQSKRTHSRYMLRKKYMNLVLHCRNVQKNYWLHLQSQRACQSPNMATSK
jgi:hypothetical protein